MNEQVIENILSLTHAHNFDDFTEDEIAESLSALDDLYNNEGDVVILHHEITDSMYDVVFQYFQKLNPAHVYFTGHGSDVRGGKVKLPFPMPGLEQKEIGDIESWIDETHLTDEEVVITDKMDGTSALIVYDSKGKLQIGFSRGNGVEGADITRHLKKIKNLPQKVSTQMVGRFEVELSDTAFEILRNAGIKSQSGNEYKNPRNMVAGIMNSSKRPAIVYEHLTVIAYSILSGEPREQDKNVQLDWLESEGFTIAEYDVVVGSKLTDKYLADYLNDRRDVLDYAIDGLVIEANEGELRDKMNIGVGTGKPKSTIKYKVADASNSHVATVDHVEWNVSKHGYLKPRVHLVPFDLCDVTISHATGFNAKFIEAGQIGPGATVQMTRSGDVIPFIQHVVKGTSAEMPTEECEWNDTGVDLVLVNKGDNEEVKIQQLIDFCSSLNIAHLKEGNVRKLYEAGITNCTELVTATLPQFFGPIGSNGMKAYNSMEERLTDVALSDVMGSVHYFGRGVGKRKFKALIKGLNDDFTSWTANHIAQVDGFDTKTAVKIMAGLNNFVDFDQQTKDIIVYKGQEVVQTHLAGQKICMTGFRDAAMATRIEDLGGDVQSGVSGKTTVLVCTDPQSNSGKAKKARDLNDSGKATIRILTQEEFQVELNTYS